MNLCLWAFLFLMKTTKTQQTTLNSLLIHQSLIKLRELRKFSASSITVIIKVNLHHLTMKMNPIITTKKRGKSSAAKRLSKHYKTPSNILEIVIETDKKTQKECHKLYSLQCPLLYKEEDVLKRCFAISIKNNRYPFLINLVDSFLRDKSLYQRAHSKKNKDLLMVKWRTTSKYFHTINKEQKRMLIPWHQELILIYVEGVHHGIMDLQNQQKYRIIFVTFHITY